MRKGEDDRVTASDVLAFIEQTCRIPEGAHVGEPVRLAPFQVEFVKEFTTTRAARDGLI